MDASDAARAADAADTPGSARWPAGSRCSTRSSGRTNGACASSRPRPACRAAPSIGFSTRWSASSCWPPPIEPASSASARCSIRQALIVGERLDLTRIARPVLERTTARTGETTILCLYAPVRQQFWAVEAAESVHPIRYIWESLRTWGELHVGSSGKGILAFLPDDDREAILARLPDPIPGLRPLSKAQLRAELDAARARGFVISHGERFQGAVGASAPIRDATGPGSRRHRDQLAGQPDERRSRARAGPGRAGRRRRDLAGPRVRGGRPPRLSASRERGRPPAEWPSLDHRRDMKRAAHRNGPLSSIRVECHVRSRGASPWLR